MSSKRSSPPAPSVRPSSSALALLGVWTLSVALLVGRSAAPLSVKALALLFLIATSVLSILSHSIRPPTHPADLLRATRATSTHALLLWRHAGHLRWTIVARAPQPTFFRKVRIHLRFSRGVGTTSAKIRAQF